MEIKLNKQELRNKILGCWIGKNIGGTMGAPYEGATNMQDISGFQTAKGNPLPNDDLDLQLVWLKALENVGPHALSSNILAEYWLSQIPPHWCEYGMCKSNMQYGIMPGLSGEYHNEWRKTSNGAWIRSELWAALAPGFPNIAAKYAVKDATIDHGISDGTNAEIFTAAMQSIAFVETDRVKLVEKALTFIPEESNVAKCARIVLSEYAKKTPYRDVRNMIVDTGIGWFQAAGNLAFMLIGFLYGEGDFKQSLIYAINCGDDTDCTAATCGATLGIMCGADKIPEELKEYVGDTIVTCCINASYNWKNPTSCTELTDRVMKMLPSMLYANDVYMEYTDGETEYNKEEAFSLMQGSTVQFMRRNPKSFEVSNGYHWNAIVEYEKDPKIAPGEEFNLKLTLSHKFRQSLRVDMELMLPEGWSARYNKSVFVGETNQLSSSTTITPIVITAGEWVDTKNTVTIKVTSHLNPMPMYIPVTFLGMEFQEEYTRLGTGQVAPVHTFE